MQIWIVIWYWSHGNTSIRKEGCRTNKTWQKLTRITRVLGSAQFSCRPGLWWVNGILKTITKWKIEVCTLNTVCYIKTWKKISMIQCNSHFFWTEVQFTLALCKNLFCKWTLQESSLKNRPKSSALVRMVLIAKGILLWCHVSWRYSRANFNCHSTVPSVPWQLSLNSRDSY